MIGASVSRVSGLALGGMLRLSRALFPAQIPVLTYHSVDKTGSFLSVGPEELREHLLEMRADHWRSLSIAEYRLLSAGKGSRERAVLITFDDGYPSFYEHALPLLAEFGVKATVFVCTDFVGQRPGWMVRDAELVQALSRRLGFGVGARDRLEEAMQGLQKQPLMGWGELRELNRAGIDVQSHGATHHFLTTLPEPQLSDNLMRSRCMLEEQLGLPVRAIAYPYGDCDQRVAQAAARAGFDIGFVTDDPPRRYGNLMRRRTDVGSRLSGADLRLLLTGWPIYPRLRKLARRRLAWLGSPRKGRPARRDDEFRGAL